MGAENTTGAESSSQLLWFLEHGPDIGEAGHIVGPTDSITIQAASIVERGGIAFVLPTPDLGVLMNGEADKWDSGDATLAGYPYTPPAIDLLPGQEQLFTVE